MKQELSIEDGNKAIAEFMGATPCKLMVKSIGEMDGYECDEWKLAIDEIEYHTSWDWLHPVIDKIKDISLSELVYEKHISEIDVLNLYITTPIKNVWEQVIYFIQWYKSINIKK